MKSRWNQVKNVIYLIFLFLDCLWQELMHKTFHQPLYFLSYFLLQGQIGIRHWSAFQKLFLSMTSNWPNYFFSQVFYFHRYDCSNNYIPPFFGPSNLGLNHFYFSSSFLSSFKSLNEMSLTKVAVKKYSL